MLWGKFIIKKKSIYIYYFYFFLFCNSKKINMFLYFEFFDLHTWENK